MLAYNYVISYIILIMHTDPIGTGNGVQQPQASATGQLQLGVCPPAPLVFSEDLSYEQLAVWLTNHPKLVGVGYKQDISKLKGTCYCQTMP